MRLFLFVFIAFSWINVYTHPRDIFLNHQFLGVYNFYQSAIQVSYLSNYRLKDLAQKKIVLHHQFKHWQFSAAYQQFGNSYYNQHYLSNLVGIQINSKLSFFTALNMQKQQVMFGHANTNWDLGAKMGLSYQMNSKWKIGLTGPNVLQKLSLLDLSSFVSFEDDKFKITATQCFNSISKKLTIQSFFQYQITPQLQSFLVYQNNTQPFGLGIQYQINSILCRIHFAYHLQLGATDGADLQWLYQSKTSELK